MRMRVTVDIKEQNIIAKDKYLAMYELEKSKPNQLYAFI